jgi:hypothetical protein
MKSRILKLMSLLLCVLSVQVISSMMSEVFADSCPDTSGNCDISGEYQIYNETVLRHVDDLAEGVCGGQETELLQYLSVGLNNLLNYPVSADDSRLCTNFNSERTNNVFLGYGIANMVGTGDDYYRVGKFGTYIGGEVMKNASVLANGDTIIGAQAGYNAYPSGMDFENLDWGYNTVIGRSAGQKMGGYNTFLGTEAGRTVTGSYNIAIGVNALANRYYETDYSGGNNIHIGNYTDMETANLKNTIVIGHKAKATASKQMVVGTYDQWGNYIEDSYWGSGVISATPQSFTFNASGGSGQDVSGADLILAGGKSTGSADGGSIIFKTSPADSSGSNQNALQTRMVIRSDGDVRIGDGSSRFTPSLIFDGQTSDSADCGFYFDSENGYINLSPSWCKINAGEGGFNFGTNLQRIEANTGLEQLKIKAGSEIVLDAGSKLKINGLPNTPPAGDSSGTKGILCITNAGNVWIDDDDTYDCD